MLSDNMEDWEGELTPKDIVLATTVSRKSLRRSMIPLDQIGSPLRCSPSKVAIRRKSVAVFMSSVAESPIASSTRQLHNLSFDSRSHRHEDKVTISPKESTPQPAAVVSPARAPPPRKMDVDRDPCPSTPIPLSKSPQKFTVPKAPPEPNGSFPFCESVDDIMRNYERELEEWPKFLASLEKKANIPFQPSLTLEEIMNDSVLKHFVEFIVPDQSNWPSSMEIQSRIKRAYAGIMGGLMRTKIEQEKHAQYMAALRETKLKELLPKLAENSSPVTRRDLLEYIPCLDERDELSQ